MVNYPTNTCLRSKFSAQPLPKSERLSPMHEAMYIYKSTQDTFYDPTKLALNFFLSDASPK